MKLILLLLFFQISALSVFADIGLPQFLNVKNSNKISFSQITPEEDYGSLVSEQSFYNIAAKVHSLYSGRAKAVGKNLIIKTLDWKVSYFSAWANKESSDTFSINFWGGMARLPYMTNSAFTLTVCHEIGHILGGEPFLKISSMAHMSAEGQADFFAAALCMKKYDLTFKLEIETEVDPYITSSCYEKFNLNSDFETCLKVAVAGVSLARALAFLSDFDGLDVSHPSEHEASETLFNSYPDIQCRLDTFVAGALSSFSIDFDLISSDAHLRPKCWFKKI